MVFGSLTFFPFDSAPMVTVKTLKDHGPYFGCLRGNYQVTSLKELIFHVRLAMEDSEDLIGVWHEDYCIGIWEDEAEPEPDGEEGWQLPPACYVLHRPGEKGFDRLVSLCKGRR